MDSFDQRIINQQHPHQNTIIAYRPWTNIVCPTLQWTTIMPVKKRNRLDKAQAQIVIVGSGLAGLSAAISLEQAGFSNIALYERDENFQVQKEGYGLTLTYNPKGPLASLGVLEQVAQLDCPSRSHYLFRVSVLFVHKPI
jgi:hypothetical protein